MVQQIQFVGFVVLLFLKLTIVKKNNNIPPFAVSFNTENHNMKIKNCYLCILIIVQADFVLIVSASRIMDKFKSESLCVKSDSIMSSNICVLRHASFISTY